MNSLNEMLEDMKNNKPSNYYKGTIYNVVKQASIQTEIAKHIGEYDNIILFYNPSGPTIEIYMYNSPNAINVNSSYRLSTYSSGWVILARSGNAILSNQSYNNQTVNGGRAYVDGNNNNQLYMAISGITIGSVSNVGSVRSQYLGWQNYVEIPPFKVTSTFEDVNVDNEQNKAFRLDYNQSFTNIGHIEDISDDSHFVNITFSQVGGGFFVRDTLNLYNMFNSSEDFYIDENYDIYIRNRLLMYNTKYLLTADTYTDSTFTTQTGNYELNYYTITPNAVITGGIITNFGSGDYNTQNSTNDLINSFNQYSPPSGDLASYLNTSGNIFSGDVLNGISAPHVGGLDNTALYDLLKAIAGTLTYSGDAYFDFSMHGETPTRIYASQFRTPDGPLKTFVSMALVFFTYYFIMLQIRHVLEMLATADFKNSLNYVDASLDNMFYM